MQDFVLNGGWHGPLGSQLGQLQVNGRFDPGLLRPYIETDPNSPFRGRPCAELTVGMVQNHDTGEWEPRRKKYLISDLQQRGINSPVFNATTLTRDAWIQIDAAVTSPPPRQRLKAYADLRAASTYGGFDAWSKLTLEYQSASEAGEAVVDMDATSEGRTDTPLADIKSIPLPITHSDFYFTQRAIDSARMSQMPLDTTMAERATRRIWESIEKTTIGTETGVTFGTRTTGPFPHTGTSTVYGFTNFPYRITKTDLNTPAGTNPEAVVQDVLEMIETMQADGYFGPYVLYTSTGYSIWLNSDYFRSGSTSAVRTVRERLMEVEGLSDIRRLDYLTSGYQLILVDYGQGLLQAVAGMEPRTVQWSERGGMLQKFMVMAIQLPLLRVPNSGIAPILHATTS
jgi:hypothetical protein